jgi:integration host factor beta subunit
MTKSGLIEKVAEKTPHISKKDTEVVVNTIFDAMTDALKRGERIEIRGFGSFQVKVREARDGRNPKTGEMVNIPAKRTPFFKVGKELKEMVDGAAPAGASKQELSA